MARIRPAVAAVVVVVVAAVLAGCGISADSTPHDVPQEQRALTVAGASSGTDASGASRIYLVAPGEQRLLRSVPRDSISRHNLVEILLLGPNETELSEQFSSSIPATTRLLSTRSQGNVFFVDLSEEITQLSGAGLIQALAQIVYTATELEGVEAVQITVEGEPLSWPTGDGEATSGPLRIYDYPGLVQTSQPPYPAVPSGI